ncbi:response regulator [Pseudoduganella danionis]|uniref:Response regulator n=1 Tax=Pseudoduganella danionis TaxID=1890295 RepID=A0ABW9SS66_9BURK|nr:response regulator [Pseudoduganella danionis]MTW34475.1 response regulator [Pseudoduganella danionis]
MSKGIILCVDDDSTVLNALRTLIGKIFGNDHLVEIAESASEALEIIEDHHKRGLQLSVVISDYIMPWMRGDELLIKLHEMYPAAIKIMLTGQSDLEGVKKAINDANLYRFIEKPFNNADLILTIRSALRAFHHEAQLNAEIDALKLQLEQKDGELAQLRGTATA